MDLFKARDDALAQLWPLYVQANGLRAAEENLPPPPRSAPPDEAELLGIGRDVYTAFNEYLQARINLMELLATIQAKAAVGEYGPKQKRAMEEGFSRLTGPTSRWNHQRLRFNLAVACDPEGGAAVLQAFARGRLRDGGASITLASVKGGGIVDENWLGEALATMAVGELGYDPTNAEDLLKRVTHVGPQRLIDGIDLDAAISIKSHLETALGATVNISETAPAKDRDRRAIPEGVRHEVWRRDEGRCVDCGSHERLEFDHIIPLSKGGSSTARNIELRCEACNRRKGATV
jgi:hypothetical protein